MDRVARVADHERWRLDPARAPSAAARCARRRGPGARRPTGAGSWLIQSSPMSPRCVRPRGTSRREPADHAGDRRAEREADQQRRERERAAEQRVVEHRHLHRPCRAAAPAPPRRPRASTFAPSDVPPTTASSRPRWSSSATTCCAEDRHRVAPHVARLVRIAVPEQVEHVYVVAARGQLLGQRAVHVRGAAAAREEDQMPRTRAVFVVDEAESSWVKCRRGGSPCGAAG